MSNLGFNESKVPLSCDKKLDLIFWVLDGAAGLVVLAGNFATCVVIIWSPLLRHSVMNIFLLSLAVADFLIGLIYVPGYASFCEGCEYVLTKHCHILSSVKELPLAAVILNLLAISYDRYMAVFNPLRYYSHMKSARVAVILIFTWGISILMVLVRFFLHHFLNSNRIANVVKIYNTFLVVTFIFLPILILLVVNVMLTRAVRRQKNRVHATRSEVMSENISTVVKEKEVLEKNNKRRKGTISCIIVVLMFIVCWFPRAYYNLWTLANKDKNINQVFRKITVFLLIMQSSVNPFIYTIYRREFRKAAKAFVRSLQLWPA